MHLLGTRLSLLPVLAVLLAACCCPCPCPCPPEGQPVPPEGTPPGPGQPHTPAYFKRLRLVNKDKTTNKKTITSATADLHDAAGGSKGSKVLVGAGGIQTTPLLPTQSVDWTLAGVTDVYTVKLTLKFSDNPNYEALICLASDEPCGSAASPAPCGAGARPIEFAQACYWGRDNWVGPLTSQHRLENNRRHYHTPTGTAWTMAESCASGGAPFNPNNSDWGKELCSGDYCYRP